MANCIYLHRDIKTVLNVFPHDCIRQKYNSWWGAWILISNTVGDFTLQFKSSAVNKLLPPLTFTLMGAR